MPSSPKEYISPWSIPSDKTRKRFFIRRTLCDVDLENFQPLARFKVQKFAEVTKFVLGFKCDSSAPQTAGGECFYRLDK